jgi:hypothetical protein
MKTFSYLWQWFAKFFSEWEMFRIKVVQKIKTHISCSVTFSNNRAVYEIMWKNMVQPDWSRENIIGRMRFACLISKATSAHPHVHTYFSRSHTHVYIPSEYVILIAFPRLQWLRERATVLRYTYIAFFLFCLCGCVVPVFICNCVFVTVF